MTEVDFEKGAKQQRAAAGDQDGVEAGPTVPQLRRLSDHLVGHRLQGSVYYRLQVHRLAVVAYLTGDDGFYDLMVPQFQVRTAARAAMGRTTEAGTL